MTNRTFALGLALIAALALGGRVAYVLGETKHHDGSFDEVLNRSSAVRLAEGDGYVEPLAFGVEDPAHYAEHPPLTFTVLAGTVLLVGDEEVPLRLTVVAFGVAAVVVIGLLARRIAGPLAGLVAAGIAAAYPNFWANDGLLMAETFATFATALALYFAYRLLQRPSWPVALALGVSCGVGMLSRGELALLLPLVALPALLVAGGRSLARTVRLGGVIVASAAIVVAPWVTYNLARFEEPVFLSYGDGGVLFGANCDSTYHGRLIGSWNGYCHAGVPEDPEPSVAAAEKRREGLRYIRNHLDRLPVVVVARVAREWGVLHPFDSLGEDRPRWVSVPGWVASWPLLALGVAGLVILRRRRVPVSPLVGTVVLVTLTAAAFHGVLRYRAPGDVAIVVLAAVAVAEIVGRVRSTGVDEPGREAGPRSPMPASSAPLVAATDS